MKVLIAPDKFKGSLPAEEVGRYIAAGLCDVLPEAAMDVVAMADGGEGTAEAVGATIGGEWVTCKAHDALGREIEARYICASHGLAVMEMSEVAGLRRLLPNERDVNRATTRGVGEMLLDAAQRGAKEIIIGLGGSATNDGGFGMARAIGFRFFAGDQELNGSVPELVRLTRIQPLASLYPPLPDQRRGKEIHAREPVRLPKITAAVDVKNPLLGSNGATRVFGPQKGATASDIETLEAALRRMAEVVAKQFGSDFRNEPGAGAAGGLGFGLMCFCRAQVQPGFAVVAGSVGLEGKIRAADYVITGEGNLDAQTLEGKTPAGVAILARKFGKKIYAIVGCAAPDEHVKRLFDAVYELKRSGTSTEEAINRAPELLRERARELGQQLKRQSSA